MTRQWRVYHTSAVVLAFARYGIPVSTISKALVVPESAVHAICLRGIREGDLIMMPQEHNELRGDYLREVTKLREQVEDLQERIRDLSQKQGGDYKDFQGIAGLTDHEARIVAALVVAGRMTKERLYYAAYGTKAENEQPEPKIIDVFVCKVRKKLARLNVEIKTLWGTGYEMSREHRNTMLQLAGRITSQSEAA